MKEYKKYIIFSKTTGPCNFNQMWHKASIGEEDSSFCK